MKDIFKSILRNSKHLNRPPLLVSTAFVFTFALLLVYAIGIFSKHYLVQAETTGWDIKNPGEYLYDSTKITIQDGVALFRNQVTPPLEEPVLDQPIEETTLQNEENAQLDPESSSASDAEAAPVEESATDTTTPATPETTDDMPAITPSNETTSDSSSESTSTTSTNDTSEATTPTSDTPSLENQASVETPSTSPSVVPTETTDTSTSEAPVAPVETTPAPAIEPSITETISNVIDTVIVEPIVEPIGELMSALFNKAPTPSAYANEYACQAMLQPTTSITPPNVSSWTGFVDDVVIVGEGAIMYQISDDNGNTWYYWNGSDWVVAVDSHDYNPAATVNANISQFPTATSLLFKAFFLTDCTEGSSVTLSSVGVVYDEIVLAVQNKTYKAINPTNAILVDPQGNTATHASKVFVQAGSQKLAYVEFVGELNLSTSATVGNSVASLLEIDNEGMQHIAKLELMIPKAPLGDEVLLCHNPTDLLNIVPGCRKEVRLSPRKSREGHFTLMRQDDPEYWHVNIDITGPIKVGGISIPAGN